MKSEPKNTATVIRVFTLALLALGGCAQSFRATIPSEVQGRIDTGSTADYSQFEPAKTSSTNYPAQLKIVVAGLSPQARALVQHDPRLDMLVEIAVDVYF